MARKKKQGRSRKGSGSVYQINENLWCGACTIGHRVETGKPIRRKVYGATRAEAEEKLAAEIHKHRGDNAGTTAEMIEARKTRPLRYDIEHWLDGTVKPRVDAATYDLHKQRVDDFILPHLGSTPAVGLNEYLIKEWYDKLEKDGCSADMRNKVGQLLRRFLDNIVEAGWMQRNPARKLPLPRVVKEEMRPLDEGQARHFLAAVRSHRLYPLWLLALDSGMRQGELIALEWSDVDLDNGIVSITKSARTADKGGVRIKEVKSRASRRRIRLTSATVEVLRSWRKAKPGKLVFPNSGRRRDRHLNKTALLRTFRKLLAKASLPSIRFHDLRHTHATLALLKTKNVKAVSARLGHADIRVTLNTYAHYLPVMEEELVAAMEEVLSPQPPYIQVDTPQAPNPR